MKCEKCGKELADYKWVKGQTYEGYEDHHNPPKFMAEKWEGEMNILCHKHHRELHDEIIKIINEKSLKFVKSEHWAWIKIIPIDRPYYIKKVKEFTEGWLNDS